MGEADPVVEHVTSSDGTRIGFHRSGEGPPLVLLHGATGAHWSFRYILPSLVERFTLYAVDRRGRGESGDAAGYAIEREFEDVAAVVDSVGEPANVFGHSYGATVALGAVLATPNIAKLVVYEASPGLSVVPHEYLERIEELVEGGEREEALVYALGLFWLTHDEVERLKAGFMTRPVEGDRYGISAAWDNKFLVSGMQDSIDEIWRLIFAAKRVPELEAQVERLRAVLEDIARGLCSANGAASTARAALDRREG